MKLKKANLVFAWVLLGASLIGWPLSMFTFAKDEPPATLSLSWLAISLTALDVVMTAAMSKGLDKDDDE